MTRIILLLLLFAFSNQSIAQSTIYTTGVNGGKFEFNENFTLDNSGRMVFAVTQGTPFVLEATYTNNTNMTDTDAQPMGADPTGTSWQLMWDGTPGLNSPATLTGNPPLNSLIGEFPLTAGDMDWMIIGLENGAQTDSTPQIVIKVQAQTGSSVPTLSQWGILLFILTILSLGLVTYYNFQTSMVTTSGTLAQPKFTIPFDWENIKTSFGYAIGAGMVGAIIVLLGWGEIIMDDVIGLTLCVILLTYLIHIVRLFKK